MPTATKQKRTKSTAKRKTEAKRRSEAALLLADIHAVNRAAKRWRDAAERHYWGCRYHLSRLAKSHKEMLYSLKDRGIAAAYAKGWIHPIEIHGGLCLYTGHGYSFHSTLKPDDVEIPTRPDDEPITILAKRQGSGEPRQCDAIARLSKLPEPNHKRFARLYVPRKWDHDPYGYY